MHTRTLRSGKPTHRRPPLPFRIEPLESRTLLSAWSTVDSFPGGSVQGMAADAAGNVYAVGETAPQGSLATYGLREKPAGSSGWTTIATEPPGAIFRAVAVDATGDVFVTGDGTVNGQSGHWLTWELPKGSTSFAQLDDGGPQSNANALAIDSAGNVYAVGRQLVTVQISKNQSTSEYEWTVRKGAYNPSSGTWAFSTVDQVATSATAGSAARGVGLVTTTINGAPSSGVYVVGNVGSDWVARKSTSGTAGTWTTIDSFRYDSTGSANSVPYSIAGDSTGDVYSAGWGVKGTFTGYVKGRATYSYATHWLVRKSADGGASWSTNDDYQYPQSSQTAEAETIGAGPAGNMYAVGRASDSAGVIHAVVRTNAGGSWATADDYTGTSGALYYGFAADASGNLYAGGHDDAGSGSWLIRSLPAGPTRLTATPDPMLPSSQIDLSWTNTAGSDETGFAIYRSTDGINFTAVASVGASATTFSDTGLAPATTYFYYVIALLNATGASAPSNTASASTST